MKPLSDVCPDPKEVLELEPEKLGHHVLGCLGETNEPNIKRAIIAHTLAANYHQSFREEITGAVEKALDWLIGQCFLGATPYDHDLIFLTQAGKDAATRHKKDADKRH